MIAVPPQELVSFLGSHLDQVLQQTGVEFVRTVAAQREFRAGCVLMDILNAVESVQDRIRALLWERQRSGQGGSDSRGSRGKGGVKGGGGGAIPEGESYDTEPTKIRITSLYLLYSLYNYLPIQQNPFLCFLVDIYTTSLMDEAQRPERFVVSVILSGDGAELAPSTPAELISIAHEVEPKRINMRLLDQYVPEVSIEDQVVLGVGWESAGQQQISVQNSEHRDGWESFMVDFREHWSRPLESVASDIGSGIQGRAIKAESNHVEEARNQNMNEKECRGEEDEEELEEWEIEAEKHFQNPDEAAPTPPTKPVSKTKKSVDSTTASRQQLNTIMELAAVQPLTFEQEQLMLSQFSADSSMVHIPLPPPEALPGTVDNNPTIAFNLLMYLIHLSDSEPGIKDGSAASPPTPANSKGTRNDVNGGSKSSSGSDTTIVDSYLDTMTHAKHLTLHSLEVVNRLSGATTLPPRFLHLYIENAIRCCEHVDDKVVQARVVRMFCVFLQSLLRNEAITIPGYFHALQSFCIQFSRVKEVATLFQTLMEYQRSND
ncbi:hypothetical protein BGW38_006677, partial [Lunasporangiospora selenospora]